MKYLVFGGLLLLLLVGITGLVHQRKPPPEGVGIAWPERPLGDAVLLHDLTWHDDTGTRHLQQQIFDDILRLISQAEQLILLDMFLFNAFQGEPPETHRALSAELTAALLARRRASPDLPIIVITDPVNTLYGGLHATHLDKMEYAGIQILETELRPLRDSNPSWSGLWRLCCQWFGNRPDGGWLPNPMGDGRVTLRSYLALPNFKANHRKTLVVDDGDSWQAIITSANPHDGSSAHSNAGVHFRGAAALDLLASEAAVLALSGVSPITTLPTPPPASVLEPGTPSLQILTEGAIRDALLDTVNHAAEGDQLDIGVFYFSHRPLHRAVQRAHARGVQVRVLLDPNKDAFGREKNGIPNRQVAARLHAAGVPVRWCDTRGEQCHTKQLHWRGTQGNAILILGSANFTRRNLDNYNLETSVRIRATPEHALMQDAQAVFEARWDNTGGRHFSLPYAAHADHTRWRQWLYTFMEMTGWSSF
ncbi:phospholipase D family protein [Isoalcanivorax indicus]|uniref:phospholipase D family protein n=1 Tax=Isoalcanivorax indicus TaxID=2202653 RepID=UPI001FEA13F8|nr:phospholipase D family protein [Isoalcanivorax indicus]